MSLKLRYLVLPGVLVAACEVPLVVQSSSPVDAAGEGGGAGTTSEGGSLGNAGSPAPEGGQPPGASGSSSGADGVMGGAGGVVTGEGGEAGAGGIVDTLTPCPAGQELKAQSISAGEWHACAVDVSGRLFCWGYGESGQLGKDNIDRSSVPVRVLTPSLPKEPMYESVQVGTLTTCALTADQEKALYCFGHGDDGVLADNPGGAEPVLLHTGVDEFALNGSHVLARVDGALFAWGSNDVGQLGLGNADGPVTAVSSVPLSFDVDLLAAGYSHSCITAATKGDVYCTGSNQDYRLGMEGGQRNSFTSLSRDGVSRLSTGYDRSCLITTLGGMLMCWGKNENPTTFAEQPLELKLPRQIGSGEWVQVSVGFNHVCVSGQDLRLLCSGRNDQGQLGNTLIGDSPVFVAPEPAFYSENFSAGREFTCAIRNDLAVVCFGANGDGQLGRGSDAASSNEPKLVCLPPP